MSLIYITFLAFCGWTLALPTNQEETMHSWMRQWPWIKTVEEGAIQPVQKAWYSTVFKQAEPIDDEEMRLDTKEANLDKREAPRDDEETHLDKRETPRDDEETHLDKREAPRDEKASKIDNGEMPRDKREAPKDKLSFFAKRVEDLFNRLIPNDRMVQDLMGYVSSVHKPNIKP